MFTTQPTEPTPAPRTNSAVASAGRLGIVVSSGNVRQIKPGRCNVVEAATKPCCKAYPRRTHNPESGVCLGEGHRRSRGCHAQACDKGDDVHGRPFKAPLRRWCASARGVAKSPSTSDLLSRLQSRYAALQRGRQRRRLLRFDRLPVARRACTAARASSRCSDRQTGSACSSDTDCESSRCASGGQASSICIEGAAGDPCDSSSDCTSGRCVTSTDHLPEDVRLRTRCRPVRPAWPIATASAGRSRRAAATPIARRAAAARAARPRSRPGARPTSRPTSRSRTAT